MNAMAPYPILYLIETGGLGGAEENLVELTARLSRDLHRPRVYLIADGWLRETLASRGVDVAMIHLERVWDWRVRLNLPLVWVLSRAIRREGASLVHAYMFEMGLHGFLAGVIARVPVVVSLRSECHEFGTGRRRFILAAMARLGCHFTAVTDAIAHRLVSECGVPRSHVLVIENGVDTSLYMPRVSPQAGRRSLGLPAEPFTVGTVARLEAVKGIDVLVQALSHLQSSTGPVQLVIAGDGSQRAQLERLSREARGGSRVHFLGTRSDVPRILAALDVFVLPSHSEGMSNALLQAMATGLPCVATAVGGNRGLLREGKVGILVPPGDPGALAGAISRLSTSAVLRAALGAAARREVDARYGMDRMVRANEALYADLIARWERGSHRQRASVDTKGSCVTSPECADSERAASRLRGA